LKTTKQSKAKEVFDEVAGRSLYVLAGGLKTRDWKSQDWKTWDQIAGVEKAELENAGTSCAWVAKCNIINVRGHVRVNVTAGRGDPRTLQ